MDGRQDIPVLVGPPFRLVLQVAWYPAVPVPLGPITRSIVKIANTAMLLGGGTTGNSDHEYSGATTQQIRTVPCHRDIGVETTESKQIRSSATNAAIATPERSIRPEFGPLPSK